VTNSDTDRPFPSVEVGSVPVRSPTRGEYRQHGATNASGIFAFNCPDLKGPRVFALHHSGWSTCIDVTGLRLPTASDDAIVLLVSDRSMEFEGGQHDQDNEVPYC
jgi:hypothetical protein